MEKKVPCVSPEIKKKKAPGVFRVFQLKRSSKNFQIFQHLSCWGPVTTKRYIYFSNIVPIKHAEKIVTIVIILVLRWNL